MFALSAQDAAVAIWPSMARALLKYLRVTRHTHIYRQSDLLEHLQAWSQYFTHTSVSQKTIT